MTVIVVLVPAALFLAGLGLAGFFWTLRSGQYEDLQGAAARILIEDEDEAAETARAATPNGLKKSAR